MLIVAIVGRPNVGKSTLFNRLTGRQHALVHDEPGVTRDRREGKANIGPLEFLAYDTAGLEQADAESLAGRMSAQSERAVLAADVALMVIDGRAGVTATDKHFATKLRKTGKPVVLAVNKAEGSAADGTLLEAHALGFGEPVAISAAHGEGLADLYAALAPFEKEEEEEAEEVESQMQIAIVGRPNAGKSTLMNALLGEERVLTGPEAGITRDAIAVPFTWRGQEIKLVDTAGMRRKANVQAKLEKMSVGDSLRAIQYAQVVILVLDATQPLEHQDNVLAALIEREGRALVLALNKWDLVKEKQKLLKEIEHRLEETLAQLKGITFVPISATKKEGLDALMKSAMQTYMTWNKRIPTGEINRWLEFALAKHAPPLVSGRRIKIRYLTQGKSRPPAFTLFANTDDIPEHYLRYLAGSLRENFDLHGIPLRITIKKPKNPYAGKKDER